MKFVLGLFALFLIPGSAIGLWEAGEVIAGRQDLWLPLLIGFATGIPVYFILIKRIPYFSTFEHELTHALVALMFFRRIRKFVVTAKRGGEVQYTGNFGGQFGTLLIGLAPYYLPTLTFLSVLARPFLGAAWFPWFDGFLGWTLAFHIFSTIDETKLSWTKQCFVGAADNRKTQTDIGKTGYILAILVIAGIGIFLLGFVLTIAGEGYAGICPFLKNVAITSFRIYRDAMNELLDTVVPVVRSWFR